jgi:hypothetical protein
MCCWLRASTTASLGATGGANKDVDTGSMSTVHAWAVQPADEGYLWLPMILSASAAQGLHCPT